MNIRNLAPGQSARIVGFKDDATNQARLLQLGFVPGSVLTLTHQSLFADPVALRIRGTDVAARLTELDSLQLAPL